MMLASGSAVGSLWIPSSPDLDSGSVFRVPESAIPSGSSAGRLRDSRKGHTHWAVVSSMRQMGPLTKRGPSQRTKAGTSLAKMTQA